MNYSGRGTRPLADWWEKASVRNCPRHVFHAEVLPRKRLFPDQLMPYLEHPDLLGISEQARVRLAARHLYNYLLFTTHVETDIVNITALALANGIMASRRQLLDVLSTYTDEAFHSYMSLDFVAKVSDATGISAVARGFSHIGAELMHAR